ncbi:MAG: hypothetical protein IT236_04470 [Bacteroidia bacterium]|nr:hypothetical protein [Bacteroidia bacterium]
MEVLIALAITSFCMSLAVVIYLNIQKSSLPFFKIKAVEMADYYLSKTLREKTFYEESFKAEEFTVKKFVSRNAMFSDAWLVRMIVFDGTRKKLFELETIVVEK